MAITKSAASSSIPSGAIEYFARATAPSGWLKADGAAVSRTTYAALFAVIGTTFGVGDGATTFGLPDLRGEFIRGLDDGRGVDAARTLGSAQADELKAHTHDIDGLRDGDEAGISSGSGPVMGQWPTKSTGGGETRPRNVAMLACIKT